MRGNRQGVLSRKDPTLTSNPIGPTCGLHEERVAVLEEDHREELPPGVGVGLGVRVGKRLGQGDQGYRFGFRCMALPLQRGWK